MATLINDKAGIRDTFKARPDLKEVHITPMGEHYFTKAHAEVGLQEGEELVTLARDSDELKDEATPAAPAKPAKA